MTAHVANYLRRCTLHLPHPVPFHVRQATTRSPRRPPLSHVWAALLILYIGSTITKQGVTQRHIAKTEQGKTVTGTGYVRCHAGMATLLRRHGNVVTAAWQRCYGPVATLLRARGNVVMGPWQRCYGPVATDEAASRNGNARVRNGFMPIRNGASDLCINYLHEKVLLAMLTWPRGHKKSTQTQQRCIHVRSFIRDRIRSGPLPYRIKRSSRYLGRFHISSSTMSSSLSMW